MPSRSVELGRRNRSAATGGMSKWDADTADWYARNIGEYARSSGGRIARPCSDDYRGGRRVRHGRRVAASCGRGDAGAPDRGGSGAPHARDARERTASHPEGARVEFREGTAEALPVKDAVADVVSAFDSFDHWLDHRGGLGEVRRVLRPQGRLAVVKDGVCPVGVRHGVRS